MNIINSIQIPRIVDGVTTFSEDDINPILDSVEGYLNEITSTLSSESNSGGVITSLSGFSTECKRGCIIALDTVNGVYVPAAARWSTSSDDGGSLIPSGDSIVVGVLLTDVSDSGSALVMCSGCIDDPELISIMTQSSNSTTGVYYLNQNGEANINPDSSGVIIPCFVYLAAGHGVRDRLIFKPQLPEYQSHSHSTYTVTGDRRDVSFSEVANLFPNISSCPVTAVTIAKDSPIDRLLSRVGVKVSVYLDGTLVDNSRWAVVDDSNVYGSGRILYLAVSVSEGSVISAAAVIPNSGITPVVKSITSESKSLTVYDIGGDYHVSFDPPTESDGENTGKCISRLTANGVSYAPAVHKLYPGVGMEIVEHKNSDGDTVPGEFDLHNANILSSQLDLNITNLNGVLFGTTSSAVSYVFPAGLTSSLHGSLRIPKTVNSLKYQINVVVKGNGSSVSDLSATVTVFRMPGKDSPSDVGTPQHTDLRGITETDSNKLYLMTGDVVGTVQGDDYIVMKLEASSPTNRIEVLTVSIELLTP